MGGYGSGRRGWRPKKDTVEDGLTLSASTLKETFNRGVPWSGIVYWTLGTKRTDSMSYAFLPYGEGGYLQLSYTTTSARGEKEDLNYQIDLARTPCHFGGQRWWFRCPLVVSGRLCDRRCGKLYLPPGGVYFGCRTCYDLTYTSCQESHKYDNMFKYLAAGTPYSPQEMRRIMEDRI